MARIKPLRSYTSGAVPTTSELEANELAINWADGKAYTKTAAGNIVSVTMGGGGGSLSATVTIPAVGDQYWESVKLLLRGNGADNGTVFADSGPASKSITRVGNTVTSTAQSKFGGASIYFDGSDSVLEVGSAYDADVAGFGTGDFTVETWFRTGSTSRMSVVSAYKAAATASGFALQLNKDDGGGPIAGSVSFGYGDTTLVSTTGGKWSANTWHHIAIVRSGTALTIYVDGVSQASATNSTDMSDGTKLSLGGLSVGSYIQDYTGYLDDFRITRAARYTTTFTPPTATYATGTFTAAQTLPVVGTGSVGSGLSWSSVPASATATGTAGQIAYDSLGNFYLCTATNTWVRSSLAAWETDPSFASVSLLLNMEGSGSTFTDYSSSPKTITALHGATQSTAAPKFGSKSLYLNGTTFGSGPYLSVPYSSAFDLSSGDWTVECWAYATALNASNNLFAINGDGSSYAQVTVVPQANGSAYLLTQGSGGDWLDTTLSAAGTFLTNTWQHVAAVRAGNVFRLYVNGVSVVSFTSSSALLNASGLSTIGARLPAGNSTVGSQTWQGYIDDFRVTKGVARYSGASLTVPAAAFPVS